MRYLLLLLLFWIPATHAARVVTLSPHATELVWFAGAGEQLVGVASFSDFPESVSSLPVIGDSTGIDRERVIALKPDLLVYWSNGIKRSDIDWLRKRGIDTFRSNPVTIEGLIAEIGRLGQLLGTETAALGTIATIEQRRSELTSLDTGRRVRMLHQLWDRPLIMLGKNDLLAKTLTLCGIENPVEIGDLPSASISPEYLLTIEADAILIGDDSTFRPFNPRKLPVMRGDNNRLYRATPRLLDAALEICRLVRESESRLGPHPQ